MLTINALGRPDPRHAEALQALVYPPARVLTATMTLLGNEDITAALTTKHGADERTHIDVFVLTPTRIIACHGEGPHEWELSDGFTDDSAAEATARRLSEVTALTTTRGKEWTNVQTLLSALGVRVSFRDGASWDIPGDRFRWDDQFSREQLSAFVSALIGVHATR